MKNTLCLATAIAVLGLSSAQAADLAARPYVKAPPMVAAVYDWTGFYVGGNVGYGWGENTDPRLSFVNPGNAGNIGSFLSTGLPGLASGNLFPNLNPNGVFGGLQLGYDKQFGTWVLGGVADIQAADFHASRLVTTPFATTGANVDESLSAKINWFGTLRGKLGYAVNDWLFYGTGGLAYGRTESSIGFACTPGGAGCGGVSFAGTAAETRVGWSAGAGLSKAFGNWNVGLEYLHVDLGRSSVTAVDQLGTFPTTTITQGQRFVVDTARLTVNYKFGGAPLVAKY
ncbi:porin family protein [Bradyrhizobium manausense]|uniref:outer membrane protein n=1 Tax=Bradyrhizobium manausense TaxID=989370 RepID=UPI001BAC5522|nr:porin family protein [Bradyrhizobium manausense]MBR0687154.1 porin family protein [Bradyrhizobium manausense]MBR0726898.1 porin family protein [Bradyrhizobium manausense]